VSFTYGLLMIMAGFGILAFGLFLFYAWLPFLYGLVGFEMGIMAGRALTGNVGAFSIGVGFACALALGAASYFLEPYRRILIGVSAGILFGLSVPGVFGLDGRLGSFLGAVLALGCGLVGGLLVPLFFDAFVIATTAVGGAAMVMIGAHHLFPGVAWLEPGSGGLIALALSVLGCVWQYRNIANWVRMVAVAQSDPGMPMKK